jgi:hypothetical protein
MEKTQILRLVLKGQVSVKFVAYLKFQTSTFIMNMIIFACIFSQTHTIVKKQTKRTLKMGIDALILGSIYVLYML